MDSSEEEERSQAHPYVNKNVGTSEQLASAPTTEDSEEEGIQPHPYVYKIGGNSEKLVSAPTMEDSEEEGGQPHPHVYKNGGNPEQLASAPHMEGMVHTTIAVDQQAEEMKVFNNLDQQVSPLPNKGPASVKTTMTFLQQQKEHRIRVANLVLRGAGVLFSLLSFVIMASDDRILEGDEVLYDVEAYRYCLAIAIIAFVYLLFQLAKGIYDTFFIPNSFPNVVFSYVDFIGDQFLAYLLMSSSSTAGSRTRFLRQFEYSRITDMAAASLSMSFVTFALMAASSLLSAFVLAKRVL